MEAPDRYVKPFGQIGDPTRRVYAGMLAALDEGLGNLTRNAPHGKGRLR